MYKRGKLKNLFLSSEYPPCADAYETDDDRADGDLWTCPRRVLCFDDLRRDDAKKSDAV